jgi:hypothetical protein
MREDGSKCEDQGEIKGKVQQFYENIFSSKPCDSVDAVLDSIPIKVTADMNSDLCKAYTDAEIETALFQMGPTKAPGPDGSPLYFIKLIGNFSKEKYVMMFGAFCVVVRFQKEFVILSLFLFLKVLSRNISRIFGPSACAMSSTKSPPRFWQIGSK